MATQLTQLHLSSPFSLGNYDNDIDNDNDNDNDNENENNKRGEVKEVICYDMGRRDKSAAFIAHNNIQITSLRFQILNLVYRA